MLTMLHHHAARWGLIVIIVLVAAWLWQRNDRAYYQGGGGGEDGGGGGGTANVAAPIEPKPSLAREEGDRWSYDGCLLIPQDQIGGVTEIIFTTPRDPTQCRRLCQQSPTARFFSYWHETGSCHLHERLPGGETEPEAMTRYLYAVPQQHWLSGHVPKARRPPHFFTPSDNC